nr:SpvB/TcaC N-terminal domain-containing protein [uncultured Desulfobacter sp.]
MGGNSNNFQSIISLPKGGGALQGIGEKFQPDLHTGTGNFSVPIAIPPGRNGFQPDLKLVYSSGNGNGPFGLGWSLSIPGVSRKTSGGVPQYNEDAQHLESSGKHDVFILSGAEDLVQISGGYPGEVVYRPRTEGLFARIIHHKTESGNYWKVESKDGLISYYGQCGESENKQATLTNPLDATQIFSWKLTETKDPFGNSICYTYTTAHEGDDQGGQILLKSIKYADYGELVARKFLVHVEFIYESRKDTFSDFRAGFETRTTHCCTAIKVNIKTSNDDVLPVREYRFKYDTDPYNGVSLLNQLDIIGFDDNGFPYKDDAPNGTYPKQLPPMTFNYTRFSPEKRRFEVIKGRDLPTRALSSPGMELVDLHGSGLPDILEMNGTVRFWRNLGNGRFDQPRTMAEAPPLSLADPGVQIIDANGDGRPDLLVTSRPLAGYYPLDHGGRWSKKSFQPYPVIPSFDFTDPEVKLVDLDGDGYTDVLRSGSRMESFFNHPDPTLAWKRTRHALRQSLDIFPNVNFSDARVRLADMTGDGLQDIVLIHDGNIEYWPNLGHNRWGERRTMKNAPRFRYGYDPKLILLGDVDGDGLADLVYVDSGKVLLWLNHSGNGWSEEPILIQGTPQVTSTDHVRLVDLYGGGVSGLLWSKDATSLSRHHMMFLDFTGGVKPYVLNEMNNHMGAVTRVEYKPSTHYFLEDQKKPDHRWRTPLPFPVQAVSKVEVIDEISRGKLTTEYRYHHGYWDGAEREFRGFGMVEQLDTETFTDYHAAGLHGDVDQFNNVPKQQFTPPLLTKTWFHQGPVGEEFGDWTELDFGDEYWSGDPHLLGHTEQVNHFLNRYNDRGQDRIPSPENRRIKRDALRTLRGSILRTELYALDDSERQHKPYTVTEYSYGLEEIETPKNAPSLKRIFFPHPTAQRTTQWERGDDPMTQFAITNYHYKDDSNNHRFDPYGRPRKQTAVATPRLKKHQKELSGAVIGTVNPNQSNVLATQSRTEYAIASTEATYIHDRVAQIKTFELAEPQSAPDDFDDDVHAALEKQWQAVRDICILFENSTGSETTIIGHQCNHYDGSEFQGLPMGRLGNHGALIRSEALVFDDELLQKAYDDRRPSYLGGTTTLPENAPPNFGDAIGYHHQTADLENHVNGYYADTLRRRLSPRGLPEAMEDALGNRASISYDEPYALLPIEVSDPLGMKTTATYNYRLLQPKTLVEPNGNSTHVEYSPIGLPAKQYINGQDEAGNTIGGTADKPEMAFTHNFLNFKKTGKPVFVHTIRRVHHASDNISDETIESREYSDGFGRLIQTRAQAEDLVFGKTGNNVGLPSAPGSTLDAAIGRRVTDSVVVSGWEVFDNKGQVVEKYEPFFSQGWDFQPENEAKTGCHVSMFYDPRGQVVRTLNPDGSQQLILFGRPVNADDLTLTIEVMASVSGSAGFLPTPWEGYTYDANDLAHLTHPDTNSVDAGHHFTPASVVLDAMGRTVCTVARNGRLPADWHITRSTYDIRGNLLTVVDALGRTAFTYHYDLLDRALSVKSIDAGRRTSVLDALGSLIEYRDSKGSIVLRSYDQLNRPDGVWAINDKSTVQKFTRREKIIYGDQCSLSDDEKRKRNLLGKPYIHLDEAGRLTLERYDVKGNLLEKSRQTIRDSELENDWIADWSNTDAENVLETTVYQTSSRYDALNRPSSITYPQDVEGQRKLLTPSYNRAGALEAVQLGDDSFVKHIAYNAKGQRILINYGNEIMTRYAYDAHTFRLARLRTEQCIYTAAHSGEDETWQGIGKPRQDFTYGYDLVGNIVSIDERVPNCGIANDANGRDRLLRKFTYDPIYRLLTATGRACKQFIGPGYAMGGKDCGTHLPGSPAPHPDNGPDQTESYTQTYSYDPAGNMLFMHYNATGGKWKRKYGMSGFTPAQWSEKISALPSSAPADWGTEGNRLTSFGAEDQAPNHDYDANGNLIRQNTERHHTWDHADRMVG